MVSDVWHYLIHRYGGPPSPEGKVKMWCVCPFHTAQNTLKLTGQDYEFANNAIEYQNCEYSGQNIHIGFSCQFLIEICNILDSENIILELADPSRPGLVRPAQEKENEELIMLLMPMRVDD